jgi:DMSO/TMAO reductase YedYZ heme-binding membrane subunit
MTASTQLAPREDAAEAGPEPPTVRAPPPAGSLLTGPRAAFLALLAAVATAAASIALHGDTSLATMKATLALISHVSSVIFLVAFVARPLNDLVRSRATRWLLKHRRYVGLSFAAWHLQHFWLIPWVAWLAGPAPFFITFHERGKLIPATFVLLMISLMAATSSNRAKRALGRKWKILHTIGLYSIFIWFVQVYVWSWFMKGHEAYTLVFTAAFTAALGTRVAAGIVKRRRRRS